MSSNLQYDVITRPDAPLMMELSELDNSTCSRDVQVQVHQVLAPTSYRDVRPKLVLYVTVHDVHSSRGRNSCSMSSSNLKIKSRSRRRFWIRYAASCDDLFTIDLRLLRVRRPIRRLCVAQQGNDNFCCLELLPIAYGYIADKCIS
jgi:hypothetical protein